MNIKQLTCDTVKLLNDENIFFGAYLFGNFVIPPEHKY